MDDGVMMRRTQGGRLDKGGQSRVITAVREGRQRNQQVQLSLQYAILPSI